MLPYIVNTLYYTEHEKCLNIGRRYREDNRLCNRMYCFLYSAGLCLNIFHILYINNNLQNYLLLSFQCRSALSFTLFYHLKNVILRRHNPMFVCIWTVKWLVTKINLKL